MKTKKELTQTEEVALALKRLRRNKDFVLFFSEIITNGVKICHIDENGIETPGIEIGIINN